MASGVRPPDDGDDLDLDNWEAGRVTEFLEPASGVGGAGGLSYVVAVAITGDRLIVLDGRVTDEKLAELLDLQTEHPMLDFKAIIDLTTTSGVVELAKDVGAFLVAGGYLIGGVDGQGVPTGQMDGCDPQLFDSANLVPKLVQFLPEPLTVHSRVTEWKGQTVVILYIARIPKAAPSSSPSGSTRSRAASPAR